MKYEQISIDIETLGTVRGSVVLSIGAVPFTVQKKFEGEQVVTDGQFLTNISVVDQLIHGLKVDEDTLDWWRKQDRKAVEALHKGSPWLLPQACDALRVYMANDCTADVKVWMKGPSFDGVLLDGIYAACNQKLPWNYWQERDVRTICDGVNEPKRLPGDTKHSALDDAEHQARWVRDALLSKEVLKGGK